jgi:type I restriction enzyme S subunit
MARILGALDDKIELNRQMNRTLESIASAIFKSWFVDFDPVIAKAAGRKPFSMSPKTIALFPDSFQESHLNNIPKGWGVSTIGEEFKLTMGQSPPGSTYNQVGEGIPFYQGCSDFGFRFPSHRIFCSAPTRYAEPGTRW